MGKKDGASATTNGDVKAANPVDLKKLFKSHGDATKVVEMARAELAKAVATRSKIVQEIAESSGSKGPFNYEGERLTIVARTNKATGEQTWFFKGPSKSEEIEI